MAVRVTKLLVNERDSECHEAVVSGSEVYEADEVSDVRLMRLVRWDSWKRVMMSLMR